MNELNVEIVQEVIALAEAAARESHSAEAALRADASGPTDLIVPFPQGWDRQPRGDGKRLIAYLRGLSELERAELVALMWIGRADDTTAAHFPVFVSRAQREGHLAEYLAQMPLAQYLCDGLRKLGCLQK